MVSHLSESIYIYIVVSHFSVSVFLWFHFFLCQYVCGFTFFCVNMFVVSHFSVSIFLWFTIFLLFLVTEEGCVILLWHSLEIFPLFCFFIPTVQGSRTK